MKPNLTIFERNVCHGLAGAALQSGADKQRLNEAEEIFLRWAPRDRFQAEAAALEWLTIGSAVALFTRLAAETADPIADGRPPHEVTPEVVEFIRRRFEFMRFPQKQAA